jgi:hypothetical protein
MNCKYGFILLFLRVWERSTAERYDNWLLLDECRRGLDGILVEGTLTNGYPVCRRCELTCGSALDGRPMYEPSFGGGVGGTDGDEAEAFQPPMKASSIGKTC